MKGIIRVACMLAALLAPPVLAQSTQAPPRMFFDDASIVPALDSGCLVSSNGSGQASLPPAHGSLRNTCSSLLRGRDAQVSIALGNGQVLIAGGFADRAPSAQDTLNCLLQNFAATCMATPLPTVLSEAELYVPLLGTFIPAPPMQVARAGAAAVGLSNGQVLIVGGFGAYDSTSDPGATAELYNPALLLFTATGAPTVRRNLGASATLLSNGKVLIAGGSFCYWKYNLYLNCDSVNSAELYDPATGKFTATGNLNTYRAGHAAVRLANGKVLIAGGDSGYPAPASAELYDPATGSFSPVGAINLPSASTTAALLPDGRVLMVTIYGSAAGIYDPANGSYSAITGPAAPYGGQAVRLSDGRIFLAPFTCNRPQIYDPATGRFSIVGTNLAQGQASYGCGSGATLLPSGDVLLTGGANSVNLLGSHSYTEYFKKAQLFTP